MTLRMSRVLPEMWWLVLICCLLAAGSAQGQNATSITSTGFRATEGGGGALTTVWTTGNLGNTWAEGEWVPYQLIINDVQADYPNLDGLPNIVMEYDFTAQNDARFVDLVRSIQVGTSVLTDAQGWPTDAGTAYPMGTRTQIEQAQNDFGNTAPLENQWTGYTLLTLPEAQVNRNAAFGTGTPSDQFHYFYITKADLIAAGVPLTANTIVIYYQLHESRSFVWANSLQEQYDQSPTDAWGGYLYSLAAYAADVRNGAGYVPGSSGQLRVSFGGGDKTVPIPIPERLPGAVSGLKWEDANGNRIKDGAETNLSGWQVYVRGSLEGITFADTTLTDGTGNYSFPNLTSGTTWYITEDAQRAVPVETGWSQTYPIGSSTMGVGSGWLVNPADPTKGEYGWQVPLTLADTGQANLNFGNMQCTVELVCPADDTVECDESTDTLYTGVPTVTANCPPYDLTYSDQTVPGPCANGYTIVRTWIVTDNVGNADTCEQNILVRDLTPPVLTCPGPVTVECLADVPAPNPSLVAPVDNCDPSPTPRFLRDDTAGTCPTIITRSYTATDACGNVDTCTQTITIDDTTPPTVTCPDPVTVECLADVPAVNVGSVSAEDACDATPTIAFLDADTVGTCPTTITRYYTATDDCGNADTCSQVITVDDQTPPVLSGCPSDTRYSCEATIPGPAAVTALDNCDGAITPTYSQTTIPGPCPQSYTLIRKWVAVDACDNADSCMQTITVYDETAPTVTCPPDTSVSCLADVPPVDESRVTATDLCDASVDVDFLYADTSEGTCPITITRYYAGTDDCGNADTCDQVITVNDLVPPVITCPDPTRVSCETAVPAPDPSLVDASDNCDPDPEVSLLKADTVGTCPKSILRYYVATDDCGNTDTCVHAITIYDETPPTITCPDAVKVQCLADVPDVDLGDVTASDLCDPDPTIAFIGADTSGTCPTVITRYFTATDECGNADTCAQTINVVDETPPVLSGCPGDTRYSCDATIPGPPNVTAVDNCSGAVTPAYNQSTIPGTCANEYTLVRRWIAVDDCGNADTCIQNIEVYDDTPPSIICPDTVRVACISQVPAPDPDAVGAKDACDADVDVALLSADTSGSCPLVITRTYEATDDCGNKASCQHVIIVNDTIAPVLAGCPADTTLLCTDEIPKPAEVTATDNCDLTLTPDYSVDSLAGECPTEYTLVRTWVATDKCGNADTCSQRIEVVDTLPPVITCAANDTIACEDSLVWTEPTAKGSCASKIVVAILSTDTTAGPGSGEFTYTRCWTATNECNELADTCCQVIVRQACGGFCTFTQGGWGSGCPATQAGDMLSTQPGCVRDHYFATVFPNGVTIGDRNGLNGGPHYAAKWTTAAAVEAFLPAGGTPKKLTADATNPTSTSAGVLAGQLLALKLNVAYSCAGVFTTLHPDDPAGCYGDFIIPEYWSSKFAGISVDSFLVIADKAISGDNSALSGFHAKLSDVNSAADSLNQGYDECMPPLPPPLLPALTKTVPETYSLEQNYPNPFNPATEITYSLPTATHVKIEIFNVLGQTVATLVNGAVEAGSHSVTWNAGANSSGVYFYRMTTSDFTVTKKMLLLK